MAEQVELVLPGVEPPLRYLPESDVIDMLRRRYTVVDTRRPSKPYRYAFADHVPLEPFDPRHICDFMALDCQSTYGEMPHRLHGFEVKASRSDWLTELRKPWKAEAFSRYCDHWWLVVSDARIVRDGELPAGWGLLAVTGTRLRTVKPAPRLSPEPWPRPLVASLARAVARAARAEVSGG